MTEEILSKELRFEILFEFPYWINLRKGRYRIRHFNILKEEIKKTEVVPSSEMDDFEDYIITLDNFVWHIGNGPIKELPSLIITEDLDKKQIISQDTLEQYFGERKDSVVFQKLKTVVFKTYRIFIDYKEEKAKTLKELISPFIEPIKKDFLYAMNEFLQIYIGYFSTKTLCNDSYLLGESSFSSDKVKIKVFIDNEEYTEKIGFPMGLFSHPFYPMVFPSLEKEKKLFEYLDTNQYPSFTKVLMGLSNNFFLHGDVRIGILYLHMALESSINDFINFYNKIRPPSELRLRKIKKNRTLGNFLKEDLPRILANIYNIDESNYYESVEKFHDERNLIIHKKKRRPNPQLEDMRDTVIDLIKKFESFMNLPIIIEDQKKDFNKLTMGIAAESFTSWGKIKLFKSFSEMVKFTEREIQEKNIKKWLEQLKEYRKF